MVAAAPAAYLKAHFGFDHPTLISFGIEPRTPKKRAKKAKAGGEGKRKGWGPGKVRMEVGWCSTRALFPRFGNERRFG
ncbi:MAG TPA: hypothetical protein VGS22_05660 [Thermoanaerobaculia bacterium]|jgi:hypothetical protein|nr:hypothetical protein [Thermoanaerobaculia bacterium]